MLFGMTLINSFTHIQEKWNFLMICVQNQWRVVHPWHGRVANLWGRHKDFNELNQNFEKSHLLNGYQFLSKFWMFIAKNILHLMNSYFFWVQCSFKKFTIRMLTLTVSTQSACSVSHVSALSQSECSVASLHISIRCLLESKPCP